MIDRAQYAATANEPTWSRNLLCLWQRRVLLIRVCIVAMLLCATVAWLLPERFNSSTTFMPPEQTNSSVAMLAALSGRTGAGGLGAIAGGLLGVRSNADLFIDLLRSGTVQGGIIDDFHLQQVYKKKYMEDVGKQLNARTSIVENKKSGVITIVITDNDRGRAQAIARDYVEQLNKLLAQVSTSSARRERIFIEQRLASVAKDLSTAQQSLAKFSTSTSTIDIKEQTHATVDAGARLQAQLIFAQSDAESLKQIYGDQNVRLKAANERIAILQHELHAIGGTTEAPSDLYPPLRSLPALGVQYADLYRKVRIQETVFEMLSAQYETARIQEAKDIPTVSVIDPPGWPERKSFPHRTILTLAGTALAFLASCFLILLRNHWSSLDETHEMKSFIAALAHKPEREAARV